jgi:quinol monooxygenase YgiN
MIVIAGSVPVRAEKREAAIGAAVEMVRATRTEPGCLSYGFYAAIDDPNRILVFEEWESEEALGRHFGTEHMKAFSRILPDVLAGPPTIKRYTVASVKPM